MKQRILSIAVIVICLSLLAGSTLAYFTKENTAHNVITSSKVDIAIRQESNDGTVSAGGNGNVAELRFEYVMPGDEMDNTISVENIGPEPVWVRISVDKAIELAAGMAPEGFTVNPDLVKLNINTEHWTEKDGWFYYLKPLPVGEDTEPLMRTITIDPSMPNEYQSSVITMTINACGVQTVHNGKTVLEAAGWPEVKEGGGA